MKKIKLALVGASGRMGQEIIELLKEAKDFEASVALVREGNCQNFKNSSTSWSQVSKADVDVIIDFSTPDSQRESLKFAIKNSCPIVSGVTGLTKKDFHALKLASDKIPVLWSPNMSLGIAVLKATLKNLAELEGFDFQITEVHHRKKKDQPSGTGIFLQEALEKLIQKKLPPVLSVRAGGIVGDHSVFAISEEESLEFTHRALDRAVFAKGAIQAARWLYLKRKPGMYSLEDLL